MEWVDISASLLALVVLEIILGIDNLVLLTILTDKLPSEHRTRARRWGLSFAWMTRLVLLATACWLVGMIKPVIEILQHVFSLRDLFFLVGGGFLITKATQEIHCFVVKPVKNSHATPKLSEQNIRKMFISVVFQVAIMDIIFSLDSVLTAIGLTSHFWIMACAITIAIGVMMWASGAVSKFINQHPTLKMLALSFLMMIGVVLIADGFAFHIPRGYIYFAMAFSLAVESLNLIRQNR